MHMMGKTLHIVAISRERQVTLLECYRPNIIQPSNDYIRSYSHTVQYSAPVANDRVYPSTTHTQVKPDDVEAFQDPCG